MIRDDIKAAQVTAMKAGDKEARAAISLIQAAIKNRDIEVRTGTAPADDDVLVVEVLQKMVKQRRESIAMYEQGGRPELAEAEARELPEGAAVEAPPAVLEAAADVAGATEDVATGEKVGWPCAAC